MPTVRSAEVALSAGNDLGESIVWDDRARELVWVDIHRGLLERWDLGDGRRTAALPDRVGAVGLGESGGFVAALADRFVLLDSDAAVVRELATVEEDLATTRLNDARMDRQGRFVCGGMDEADPQRAISSVYRLDADGSASEVIAGIACANSLAFSPDGRVMYFSDMPTGRILVYDYDIDEGIPHDPRVFADGSEHPGLPDGSTVDAEGCLWNARWGAGTVIRYAPDGTVDTVVQIAATNPTCPVFGGPDHSTLFVTSARFGRSEQELAEEPNAGSVFAINPSAGGMADSRYRTAVI